MSRKKARRARENRPTSDARPAQQPAAAASISASWRWPSWLWGFLIVAATLGAYWPALNGAFVFDDPIWTTGVEKLLRDSSGLWEIWTRPTALQQYYPVTGTSFWLDYHLWHWWTLPYHVENVLLHAASALLLWRLLLKLEVPGAWLAGALFALHPVMVESTAWITERKNVLSMFFFLAALLAYGRFTSFWKEEESPNAPWLVLCAGPGAVCWRAALEDHGLCAARGASAVVLVEARAHSREGGRAADPAVLCALHWSGTRGGLAGEASCGGAGRRLGSELAGTHPGGRPGAVVLCLGSCSGRFTRV